MSKKFRIHSIKIEGFKGFTKPQEIMINEKNVFIFGPNTFGKSSIAEAIVWCLFGSEKGKDFQPKNVFYGGECKVVLSLMKEDKIWKFSRRIPLESSLSDVTITNPEGETFNEVYKILPQLKKLSHGEGAHVLFSQQERAQRYLADLSDFEGVIAAYLNLDRAMKIIEQIDKQIQGYEERFKEIQKERENFQKQIDEKSKHLMEEINKITDNPPWSERIPSVDETISKLRQKYQEILHIIHSEPDESLFDNPLSEVTDSLNEMLDTPITQKKLKEIINDREEILKGLRKLKDSFVSTDDKINEINVQLETLRNELNNLSSSNDENKIKEKLVSIEKVLSQKNKRDEVIKSVIDYFKEYGDSKCLVCDNEFPSGELSKKLNHIMDLLEGTPLIDEKNKLKGRLLEMENLKDTINTMNDDLRSKLTVRLSIKQEIIKLLNLREKDEINSKLLDESISNINRELIGLKEDLEGDDAKLNSIKEKLKLLKIECEYHLLIEKQEKHDEFVSSYELNSLDESIDELHNFLDRLKQIRETLRQSYYGAFDKQIPIVNKEIEKVYKSLTDQKSFESAQIKRDETKIKIVVGDTEKNIWMSPESVLNTQAKRAIEIVPYFAFSKLEMLNHELDFLIVDDPSQSFDIKRAEELMKLLNSVSNEAQIIVATHDKERFEPKDFSSKDLKIIEVKDFDKFNGPKIEEEEIGKF